MIQDSDLAVEHRFEPTEHALDALSSLAIWPPAVTALASETSCWLLVIAIAAAGVKTSFEDLLQLGWQPVLMLFVETFFIAVFVLVALLV